MKNHILVINFALGVSVAETLETADAKVFTP